MNSGTVRSQPTRTHMITPLNSIITPVKNILSTPPPVRTIIKNTSAARKMIPLAAITMYISPFAMG